LSKSSDESLEAVYADDGRKVHALYHLGKDHNFFEKRLALVTSAPCRLKTILVTRLALSGTPLKIEKYPHQKMVTYFARTDQGGIFLGLEKPFDSSSFEGTTVSLGYSASLKVDANYRLESEPMYLGVYRRQPGDVQQPGLPLQSESDAMVAMTSRILPPSGVNLVAFPRKFESTWASRSASPWTMTAVSGRAASRFCLLARAAP